MPDDSTTIEFTIDTTAFGINGRYPCTTDHIEFFDGTGSNANSLDIICGHISVNDFSAPIVTTGSQARVVFTGSDRFRAASRVGVKVNYRMVSAPTTPSGRHYLQFFEIVLNSLCILQW